MKNNKNYMQKDIVSKIVKASNIINAINRKSKGNYITLSETAIRSMTNRIKWDIIEKYENLLTENDIDELMRYETKAEDFLNYYTVEFENLIKQKIRKNKINRLWT